MRERGARPVNLPAPLSRFCTDSGLSLGGFSLFDDDGPQASAV